MFTNPASKQCGANQLNSMYAKLQHTGWLDSLWWTLRIKKLTVEPVFYNGSLKGSFLTPGWEEDSSGDNTAAGVSGSLLAGADSLLWK